MIIGLALHAMNFLGTPYSWGGNHYETGFDCSGFVNEMLRSFDYIGHEDYTAQGLFNVLQVRNYMTPALIAEDDILFFGKNKITHVAIAINDWQLVEAGGEGRVETEKGAVRIRPINHRNDFYAAIRLPIAGPNEE